ncbi:MAG: hypothetical protein ACI4C1_05965 [Lachnospiraceae bacterium]
MENLDNNQAAQLEITLLKNVYTSERPQMLLKCLLARYGVMEINQLYEIFRALLGAPLKYEIFEASYLAELLQMKACTYVEEDNITYLSGYSKLETKKILKQRKQYPELGYPFYSREQIANFLENGFYCDSEAYVKLEQYLCTRRMIKKENREYILKYISKSGGLERAGDGVLKNIRNNEKKYGQKFPKEVQQLIIDATRQMPIAAKYGWTNQDYQRFQQDGYASMKTISQFKEEQSEMMEHSPADEEVRLNSNSNPMKRKKKNIEGQMTLFDFFEGE